MIIDALLSVFATILNQLIGGIIKLLGNPVTLSTELLETITETKEKLGLIYIFVPLDAITNCLTILATALGTWALFKLTMWILDILRIGKSYNE